jgi:23S rRNA maturation mini-RNase III
MVPTQRRYSKEEFARRGDAIYEKEIRPQLKTSDEGKFAAIDIETEEFVIAADELKACHKLRKRIPDAQIWMVRVGHPYVHRIGGRERREAP